MFYRQVFELDYDLRAEISALFLNKVQNKIHCAIHGRIAAVGGFGRVSHMIVYLNREVKPEVQTNATKMLTDKKENRYYYKTDN